MVPETRPAIPSHELGNPSWTHWWRLGVIGGVALLLALGSLALIRVLAEPLMLVMAAIIIGEALAPIVDWLDQHLPRTIAIAIVYAILLAIVAVLGWLVLPVMVAQTQELIANGPDLINAMQRWLDHWGVTGGLRLRELLTVGLNRGSDLLTALPFTLADSAFKFIAVIFMSVYWLLEVGALKRFTLSLFPPRHREHASTVIAEMGHSIGGYIRGVVLDAAVVGGLAYLGLLVLGVRYALVLGVTTMLGELIPVLGPFIAAIPAVAVGLLDSPKQALIVLGFYVLLEQLEGHLVTPNIMRSQTDVPQLLVLAALLGGAAIGGLLGVFVAIPLAGAARILVLRVIAPAIRRWDDAPPTDNDERNDDDKDRDE